MTKERMKVVDYTMHEYAQAGYIYVKNPVESVDWDVLLKPFSFWAWTGVSLFIIMIPIAMTLANFAGMIK